MPLNFPYTYVSCPCTNSSSHVSAHHLNSSFTARHDDLHAQDVDDDDNNSDEQTFNPQTPRANYSLFPLDHLLYCEDCHEMRCPRCILEEIICWYCPNCLFEVPMTMVRGGENRCQRNCYLCPECTAPLALVSRETSDSNRLAAPPESQKGPWVFTCQHCCWTSEEIGVVFDKPNGIAEQLAATTKSRNGGGGSRGLNNKQIPDETEEDEEGDDEDDEGQFDKLRAFYQSQLSKSTPQTAGGSTVDIHAGGNGGSYRYGSPGTLARLVNLYTGAGNQLQRTSKDHNGLMREANNIEEGLKIIGKNNEEVVIEKMKRAKWDDLASSMQRVDINTQSRFTRDLKPLRPLLRTKRSKRCRTCRHILVKPEPKLSTTRFRIRLLAKNYIPTITLTRLSSSSTKKIHPSSTLTSFPPSLSKNTTTRFLLTVRNPLYETLQITLATPSQTPSSSSHSRTTTTSSPNSHSRRHRHDDNHGYSAKVVILCPQFEVGPNRDVWEEALGTGPDNGGRGTAITGGGSSSSNRQKETDRERNGGKSGMGLISTTSSSSITTLGGGGGGGGGGGAAKEEMMGPEAGKIWERGANWTTVVVEVTPFLAPSSSSSSEEEERGESTSANAAGGNGTTASDGGTITPAAVVEGGVTTTTTKAAEGNNDDSDSSDSSSDNDNENDVGNKLLEIPIFIRIEYETTTSSTTTASTTVAATGSSHVGKNHLKKSGLSKNHDFNHDNDDGHEDGEEEVGGEGRGVSGGKGGEGRENREMAYWIVTGVGIIQ